MLETIAVRYHELIETVAHTLPYCPLLLTVTDERRESLKGSSFFRKVLIAFIAQIAVLIVGVTAGSYITVQILSSQMQNMTVNQERDSISLHARQDALTARVTTNEKDIAGIKARDSFIDAQRDGKSRP